MKKSVKFLLAMGLVIAHGGLAGNVVMAAEEGQEYQSYGTTIILEKEPVQKIFSHVSHVVEHKIDCASCHDKLFERKNGTAKAKGDFTMASFSKGMYCGACHDGEQAFDIVAPETMVFQKPVQAVVFEHQGHIDLGIDCSACHTQVFTTKVGAAEASPEKFTMQALYDGLYCGACHNGEDAFASDTQCASCHIGVQGYNRMFEKDTPHADKH